jgi:hypothetical protein
MPPSEKLTEALMERRYWEAVNHERFKIEVRRWKVIEPCR